MVNLDGAHGEGGGQMLRTALVCSLITGTPFRMERIRANRPTPGMKAQHVQVLKSLRPLGDVKFSGAAVGSDVVTFTPAPLQGAEFKVDIGTAGSIPLLLQTLLPAALVARGASRVELTGGTDGAWAPPVDYVSRVILGTARERSRRLDLEVVRRGFYPRGGGQVLLQVEGGKSDVKPIDRVERGKLSRIRVFSVASRMLEERRVAQRQSEAAVAWLDRHSAPVESEATYAETFSPGSVVTCVAEFDGGSVLGGSALGERQKRAEDVGREAADGLSAEIASGSCVDEHAADQLILWLALAGGRIRASRISDHTRTNIWVTEQFLGRRFKLDGPEIHCECPYVTS